MTTEARPTRARPRAKAGDKGVFSVLSRMRPGAGDRRPRALLAAAVAAAALLSGAAAQAQTAREDSVAKRPRPDFDPIGLDLDLLVDYVGRAVGAVDGPPRDPRNFATGWVVAPSFGVAAEYDDNVFRTQNDTRADTLTRFTPALQLSSDWDNHGLNFGAGADVTRHAKLASEDADNFNINGGGFVDVTDEWRAGLTARYERVQEPRGTPEDPGRSSKPPRYYLTTVTAETPYAGDPVVLRPVFQVKDYAFIEDGTAASGDRDRAEYLLTSRAGYAVDEGTVVFVEPRLNRRRYARSVDTQGFRRDSEGYEILAGVSWDASGVTFLEAAAGYLQQRYEDPRFQTVSGPLFTASAVWNPLDVLTLTFDAGRRVEETTLENVSSSLGTSFGVGAEYEIDDNLWAAANAGWSRLDYNGVAPGQSAERRDRISSYGLGLNYLISPNMRSGLSWAHASRKSNIDGIDYTSNRYVASITFAW